MRVRARGGSSVGLDNGPDTMQGAAKHTGTTGTIISTGTEISGPKAGGGGRRGGR
jgi:hypothetical protein